MLNSDPPGLSRRRFLAASTGMVGLAVVTSCGVPTDEDTPDPVLDLIRAAERDAREFGAADASHGTYRDAIRRIADVRELVERPVEAGAQEPTATTAATAETESETNPVCPPVDEVRSRLLADAGGAAEVAVTSEGVRAELTGAVSAACTAAAEVLLS